MYFIFWFGIHNLEYKVSFFHRCSTISYHKAGIAADVNRRKSCMFYALSHLMSNAFKLNLKLLAVYVSTESGVIRYE